MSLPFVKMHGLGNDFILIDDLARPTGTAIMPELARKLCDRRFGIGADQVLWLRKPKNSASDARLEILNADGSTAEMCGNGIRAVAIYLQKSQPNKTEFRVDTLAGIKVLQIQPNQNVLV